MLAAVLADAVLLLHALFVVFVAFGAVLLWRWPRILRLHAPAALWGAFVEFSGTECPLTPLENVLRKAAGGSGYAGSFVEHHVVPLLYPVGLTRDLQWFLGVAVLLLNALLYGLWWTRRRGRPGTKAEPPS